VLDFTWRWELTYLISSGHLFVGAKIRQAIDDVAGASRALLRFIGFRSHLHRNHTSSREVIDAGGDFKIALLVDNLIFSWTITREATGQEICSSAQVFCSEELRVERGEWRWRVKGVRINRELNFGLAFGLVRWPG
jgi:hypothetical protein